MYGCKKICMTAFYNYTCKIATFAIVFRFLSVYTYAVFYVLWVSVCLSKGAIVYCVLCKSIYVTQSKSFLSLFLNFLNVLE